MFGLKFMKPKQVDVVDPSNLFKTIALDLHSHLIPRIDDGVPDLNNAIDLIKSMHSWGFKKIITTPHVSELYPNTTDTVLDGFFLLKREVKKHNIPIQIDVAAEYMINDMFEQLLLSDTPLLTLPNKHILVEMPHLGEPVNLDNVLKLLIKKGYTPLIAHPERYRFYENDLDAYAELKDKGCLFQANLLSFTGYYGRVINKTAWSMINDNMIDFIGTDMHHIRHLENIENSITPELADMIGHYPFKNKQLLNLSDDQNLT
jgi:protein-tyrosine phosphatase